MSQKPVILLCWGYERKAWVELFESLRTDFDLVYLYYRNKQEDGIPTMIDRRIYWDDYKSAHEIINDIKPSKIVFMSISSGYGIALNMAARRAKVPTLILQHGLFRTYREYRELEKLANAHASQVTTHTAQRTAPSGSNTMKFLLKSTPFLSLFALPWFFLYFILQRKVGSSYAAKKVFFRQRVASRYVCFSPTNATIHRELDRIKEDKIVYIGVPELDPYFSNSSSPIQPPQDPYYLFIDQPFEGNPYRNYGISTDDKNELYVKLAEWCAENNHRLKIKLHPVSYKNEWLAKHPSIDYVRQTDMAALLAGATGVFGGTSTLMLPAVYLKPVFLLLIHDSTFQGRVLELGLAHGGDFFKCAKEEIKFVTDRDPEALKKFENEFLFKADGLAMSRLKDALSENYSE